MNQNELRTSEIVFILDKSGSMHAVTEDTIGGFNSTLQEQQAASAGGYLTTILFDNHISTLHDRLPLKDVQPLTTKEYRASGCTALLDAIGTTIRHIEQVHHYIRPEDVPEKTLFVIMTDGLENASHSFTGDQVRGMIDEKQKAGWEFVFLGANIDAVEAASRIGIDEEHTANFHQDEEGIDLAFKSVNGFLNSRRMMSAPMEATGAWKQSVESDFNSRKKR